MEMKQVYLYCDPKSLNDATNYYVDLMTRPFKSKNYQVTTVHNLSEIKSPDVIITITEKYFFFAKLRFPFTKTIYWAQGVDAEEAKMNITTFVQRLRYLFRRFVEPIAVTKCSLLFCVSNRMVEYYCKNYGLKNNGQIVVMPCYNLPLSPDYNIEQYQEPVFAYAGNTGIWQGVDFMLDVFAVIEKSIPKSCFRIFTGNKEEFELKLRERGIVNYDIKYVPVKQLQEELHKCKYGFILRTDHIVNQVATPTKMNSYLAAYMIPIFSDGVDDFKRNVNLEEFEIMGSCPLNVNTIAKQIIEFEKTSKDYTKYKSIVQKIFDNHYNDSKYEYGISRMVDKFIINGK